MRRVPPPLKTRPLYKISSIRPIFFWEECQECGYEFRREELHYISIRYFQKYPKSEGIDNMGTTDSYIFCTNCCPRREDAKRLFETKYLGRYDI